MLNPSILLLGATGATGLTFIEYATTLNPLPKLTLYVRNSSKLPKDLPESFRVVTGALDDRAKVDEGMEGVDVVVSVLGAYPSFWNVIDRSLATPIADALEVVKDSMKAHNVRRVLALSTPAHDTPGEILSWPQHIGQKVIPPLMTPIGSATMTAIAKLFHDDSLDYTIFRVRFLSNGEAGRVYAGFYGPGYQGSQSLSRASMVRWILEEIEKNDWVRQEPVLGN